MTGHSEILIDALPERVFDAIADFSKHRAWNKRLRIQPHTPGPTRVGSTFTSWGRHPEKHRPNHETVTEYDAGHALAFDGVDERLGVFHHRFTVEPAGASTRVTRTASADLAPRPVRLLLPLASRTLVPYMLRRDLRALKRHCESDNDW
jgi:uncharacterized protein YndB with AHSA1/START domain